MTAVLVVLAPITGQAPSASAQTGPTRELVVREVLLPHTGVWESVWSPPYVAVDPNSQSSSAVFFSEAIRGPGFLQGPPIAPLSVLSDRNRTWTSGLDTVRNVRVYSSDLEDSLVCLVSNAVETRLFGVNPAALTSINVWSLGTKELLMELPPPPPEPGHSALSWLSFLQGAGDVNSDGWTDVFFQGLTSAGEGVSGCLDGNSGAVLWQHYVNEAASSSRVQLAPPFQPKDVNGDSIPDQLVGFELIRFGNHQHYLAALSGADGAQIWAREINRARSNNSRVSICTPDIDGDGVSDIVSLDPPDVQNGKFGSLRALSGANGANLWSTDTAAVQNLLPNATVFGLGGPGFVSPEVGGNAQELTLTCTYVTTNSNTFTALIDFALDSGAALRVSHLPGSIAPWHPTSIPVDTLPVRHIGDIDADGFDEFAIQVWMDAEDTNATPYIPAAVAIIGQRTLFGPDAPQVGNTVDLHLAMPSIPGAAFQIVLSSKFVRRTEAGALELDRWPTCLKDSGLAQRTLADPRLRGQLDAFGQGKVSLPIPSNPALVGLTVYARAVVEDPSRPGSIFTQSSLHSMTLQT